MSYQQRVYKTTLATVKCPIQLVENPTPAVVISVEAARIHNAIVLDYFISEVALEEPEITSTDPNLAIDNNPMHDEVHSAMPGGSGHYEAEGDESDVHNVIPTARRRRRCSTELERFDLGMSDINGYEG